MSDLDFVKASLAADDRIDPTFRAVVSEPEPRKRCNCPTCGAKPCDCDSCEMFGEPVNTFAGFDHVKLHALLEAARAMVPFVIAWDTYYASEIASGRNGTDAPESLMNAKFDAEFAFRDAAVSLIAPSHPLHVVDRIAAARATLAGAR